MDFDFPGRFIVGIIAIILVTLYPLQYLAQSTNENISNQVDEKTQSLAVSIRDKGYLDVTMYEEYMSYLSGTGELYDVKMEDIHPVTGEEVAHNCSDEDHIHFTSIDKQNYQNDLLNLSTKISKSDPRLREIPKGLEPIQSINRATLDNSAVHNISSFSVHTHTSNCYSGHNHTAGACTRGYVCCNNPDIYYRNEYPNYGRQVQQFICRSCQKVVLYMQWEIGYTSGNYYVAALRHHKYNGITTKILAQTNYDSAGGYAGGYEAREIFDTINYMSMVERNSLTLQKLYERFPILNKYNAEDYEYYAYNPPYACGYTTEDTTPICNQVVTSIYSTNPNQTIKQGQTIDSTATATYLDGHTGTVSCSVSGFNTNTIGVQTVTLTYTGRVDNAKTWGAKTCTVTVTVQSAAKKCNAGLGHPDYDGNLSECPVCKAISGIAANNQTFVYDGNHHELAIGNSTGTIVNVAYDIDPTPAGIVWQWITGPVLPGTYPAHIYVHVYNSLTGTWGDYFVMERYITIQARLSYITVSPSNQTIQRYSSPVFTVTAYYEDGSSSSLFNGYNISGLNTNNIGSQTATISYTNNGITKSATAQVKVTGLIITCPRCSYTYELGSDDVDHGCLKCKTIVESIKVTPDYLELTQGNLLPITVKAIMRDGSNYDVTAWTSNYDPNKLGLQTVTVEYGGFAVMITVWVNEKQIICPICHTPYPISLPKCPICSTKVASISVSPKVVTVNQYEDINLNVIAHYADGSSSPVDGWSIDKTSSVAGIFTATVEYENVSTSITLKVISLSAVECPICGTVYEPSENPSGCPICSKTITGIEAYLTSGSNLVQYGSTPSLSIVLIYKDTHREITEDGYTIEDYRPDLMGAQTIKVIYKEFNTLLDIEVVNTLLSITCPNGHVYYRNEDGSDPGCPYCTVSEDIDTVFYYDITYVDEIIENLYTDGIYYFKSGNYLTIHVSKKNKSLLDKMQNIFFRLTLIGRKEEYLYGGEVF